MRASTSLRVASVMLCAFAIACNEPTTPVQRNPATALTVGPGGLGAMRLVPPASPLSYVVEVPNATGHYVPIHTADMNGDGRPEILTGNWDTNRIEIWKYDQALQKAVLSEEIVGLPYNAHGISSGDVDKDGDIDVLVAVRFYGVYLCRNDGAGSWTVTNLYPVYAWNTQVADFDHDGNLDVFGSLDYGSVLLYGDGAGGFSTGAVPDIIAPVGINVADFNRDGWPDLIGPDRGTGHLVAYENMGDRTWSANLGPSNYYPHQLVSDLTPSALDLYGNGNLDQVALFHSADDYVPPMSVVIFEGSGAPGSPVWTPRVLDVLPNRSLPIGAADLDDDGHRDIFVGGAHGFLGFRAYRGDGLGNFTAEDVPYTYGLGSRNSFSVVDFNGDGTSDIVAARHNLGAYEPSVGFAILYRLPPPNIAPAVDAGSDATVLEGGTFSQGGSFTDPDANTWTATVDYGDLSPVQTLPLSGHTFNLDHVYAQDGSYTVTVTVTDDQQGSGSDQVTVMVDNVAPVVAAGADATIVEGATFAQSGSFTDPGADTWSATVDYGDGSSVGALTLSGKTFVLNHTYADNGVYTVTVKVDDDDTFGTDQVTVSVTNVAPTLTSIVGSPAPIAVNASTSVTLAFTDPAAALDNPYSVSVNWDDGAGFRSAGTLTYPGGSINHTFTTPSLYTVCARVTDKNGGVSNTLCFAYIVVYDPSGGSVTGNGWINSPAGAYKPNPNVAGRVTFDFDSKYRWWAKMPTGGTEFRFHAANLNFASTSYQWLVVSGPLAQYKGNGRLNGVPGYGFILSAWDGKVHGGGGVDRFRMKIYRLSNPNVVIYDNQGGTDDQVPTTALRGGWILVRK